MRRNLPCTWLLQLFILAAALTQLCSITRATQRYVSPSGSSVPPFTDWSTAATNIQDAIDASSDGDIVLVTNGVYSSGGRVMYGDLTNRAALTSALTLQSINGPTVTFIQGAGITNGTAAIRCAWLTNGAVLSGFTITGGATRNSGDTINLSSGGGVWCASPAALVTNCFLFTNVASSYGGGIFQGTINNSLIISNRANNSGGGAYQAAINNSLLSSGAALISAGGAYGGILNNCTVISNNQSGVISSTATNCIVLYNNPGNYVSSTLSYCCSTPLASGAGNFTNPPQLLVDGFHLSSTSPCRAAGTGTGFGTDIDGQPWGSPPSIGCDDWQPPPVIIGQPRTQLLAGQAGFGVNVLVAGQDPFTCYWSKDGTPLENNGHYSSAHITSLVVDPLTVQDAGAYQVVVSNSFGMTTSTVAEVVLHFVNVACTSPNPPYLTWATAATNIQDAIAAANAQEFVLVTNGIYNSGGKVIYGDLTNRVALDKPLAVRSVGGPYATVIQGSLTTNGPAGVRCAWLTNGAVLSGFTLTGGATRNTGDSVSAESGGAVWCASSNSIVVNCLIGTNSAFNYAGGAYQGFLQNCFLFGNQSQSGGGPSAGYNCMLVNCTVVSNSAGSIAGVALTTCSGTNIISFFNKGNNYSGGTFSYCCTTPLPSGTGNISSAPLLLPDSLHLLSTSPCIGAGTNVTTGTDLDGHTWNNPPSIGCEEWTPAPVIAVQPQVQINTNPPFGFSISVFASAQQPFTCYWMRNGVLLTNDSIYSSASSTNLIVSGINFLATGNYQVVVSNAFGMVTSAVAQVVMHCVDAANTTPAAPYLSWSTAATNIQDAIDAAQAGEIVVVTNGVYANGGKVTYSTLTNRVAINKPIMVYGLSGPYKTFIQGTWNPVTTNGTGAVRCAWLTNGAVLSGFTLQGGATLSSFGDTLSSSGGGVWSSSTNTLIYNCVIFGNSAYVSGGGAYSGELQNCWIEFNTAYCSGSSAGGGGTIQSTALNSVIANNQAITSSGTAVGGGANGGTLINCTVVNNSAGFSGSGSGNGGGFYSATGGASALNCIICSNSASLAGPNYVGVSLQFCDTTPLSTGLGNITNEPQLFADGFHISSTSPCRGAGTNVVIGTDIDGQSWNSPPSIGCDEWQQTPAILAPPALGVTSTPGVLTMYVRVVGQAPYTSYWTKDGAPLSDNSHYAQSNTTNLLINTLGPADSGAYQVTVSNSFGTVRSILAQTTLHFVDANGNNPTAPFLGWQTAATNIQDALDAATGGDVVLATNGLYVSGGRVVSGDLTNRVALTKALLLMSANGATAATIQGAWDSATTNGPGAIRCAWVTNGALLSGFTLEGGATRTNGSVPALQRGGGALCGVAPFPGTVANCIISNNSAAWDGGGAAQGVLNNCIIVNNSAGQYGGGARNVALQNCFIEGNFASIQGGGVYQGSVQNCTIISNTAAGGAGGVAIGWFGPPIILNSIIYFNSASSNANVLYILGPPAPWATPAYCCTTPLPPGPGNISADPQLLDSFHIAATSPCRGAGSASDLFGTDLDGEPWTNPPSIGCDEVYEANITGPLSVSANAAWSFVAQTGAMPLLGQVSGRASRVGWDFGDGSIQTNVSLLTTAHAWSNVGTYTVTFTAFNSSNPSGVSTNFTVDVVPLVSPALSSGTLVGANFNLSFPGQPGITYVVEQTTNLVSPITWQPVTSVFSTGSVMQVTDPQATNVMEFYRLRTQ